MSSVYIHASSIQINIMTLTLIVINCMQCPWKNELLCQLTVVQGSFQMHARIIELKSIVILRSQTLQHRTLLLIVVLIVFAHTAKFCQFLFAGKTNHKHNI